MREHMKILIVDDTPLNIKVLNDLLKADYDIYATNNGAEALRLVPRLKPDLILLDIMMPEMDGYEVCRRLKADKHTATIPVLFVTARIGTEDETKGLELGAVDYITKPINPAVVIARIKSHITLHHYQEHLRDMVAEKTRQLRDGYMETVHRLVLASEFKDEDTGAHIRRISYYTRELARSMNLGQAFAENIFYASPMHDIGKVAIPDAILLKKGSLDNDEWAIMKTHAAIGAQILADSVSPYLRMAVDIAGCHHERWDGSGYPKGLKGEAIPLTARIMNITDQYDALRSKRPYKPALDHDKVVTIITEGDGRTMVDHFDPDVLAAFKKSLDICRDIYDSQSDKI